MTTLADIRKAAETPVHTCTDATTPDGYFVATTKILGITTTYLLRGVLNDLAATVVGRIDMPSVDARPLVYRGGNLRGGQWITATDSADAFRKMIGADQ